MKQRWTTNEGKAILRHSMADVKARTLGIFQTSSASERGQTDSNERKRGKRERGSWIFQWYLTRIFGSKIRNNRICISFQFTHFHGFELRVKRRKQKFPKTAEDLTKIIESAMESLPRSWIARKSLPRLFSKSQMFPQCYNGVSSKNHPRIINGTSIFRNNLIVRIFLFHSLHQMFNVSSTLHRFCNVAASLNWLVSMTTSRWFIRVLNWIELNWIESSSTELNLVA